ncbi:MAG: uroporphyrinogen decarboxylase family protein [Anaerolineaceae bacterium]|nr:uroporphyrinogen decarboxylase family protein [Anaerolineaceae bacterium]
MDEMDPRDRIDAALALKPVDRAPVIPLMDIYSARYEGVKMASVVRDMDLARDVMIKAFDDLGGWDATFFPGGLVTDIGWGMFGMASRLPGYELGEDDLWQLDEKDIMKPEDYDFVIKNGWNAYLGYVYPRVGAPCPPERFLPRLMEIAQQGVKDTLIWEAKGVSVFAGLGAQPPFEAISFTRSLKETVSDVFRRPAPLEAAMEAYMAEQMPFTIGNFQLVKKLTKWGDRVAFIGATRAPFLSPPNFQRFFWKSLKRIVNEYLEAGITPMLHFDSNWDKYLECFLELPKGQVLLEIDSTTNIFKAKEILKGHMCIMGDVPASLLKLGTPEQVTDYVKKLIDVVGEDSGFILSTGCDCPIDAKPENVKAMIETGKTYNPHHKVF